MYLLGHLRISVNLGIGGTQVDYLGVCSRRVSSQLNAVVSKRPATRSLQYYLKSCASSEECMKYFEPYSACTVPGTSAANMGATDYRRENAHPIYAFASVALWLHIK